jgi:hypothetical protein
VVWDVDREQRHRLNLAREPGAARPIRIVRLTSTGALVSDGVARSGAVVPDGAGRIVVLDAESGEPGWDAGTSLFPAAPSALLGVRSTVRLPRPWTAPPRYLRLGEHTPLPAALVVAGQDGVMTDLPAGVRAVVVELDRIAPDATVDRIRIEVSGGAARRRRTRVTGERARIVVPVEDTGDARVVTVTVTAPGWQLAGVRGQPDAVPGRPLSAGSRPAPSPRTPVSVALHPVPARGRTR